MKLPINQIICGDCLEIMKDWPDGCVDLVLTDPPYGINYENQKPNYTDYGKIINDDKILNFSVLYKIGIEIVIFGANNFYSELPKLDKFGWIVWDKRCCDKADKALGSPFEIAFTTKERYYKFYRVQHGGRVNSDKGKRFHPTQKPILLMQKILMDFTNPNDLILDPFCGSGTTCVAAKVLGRRYIGIDISPEYCKIAEDRLRAVDTGVPVKEARAGQGALFE